MNDVMKPPSFEVLLSKVLTEYREKGSVLGVKVARDSIDFVSPIGPAAGPHTQLAGNIITSFIAGGNHFELKTVQILEGEALGIRKPCIAGRHEVYNVEWSTELTVNQALEEYIKAYVINYVLAIEYGIADPSDLNYIMSVGYDYEGITSQKMTDYIDTMKMARNHPAFIECIYTLLQAFDHYQFKVFTKEAVHMIPSCLSDTVALSTMHGCKKEEIAKIAAYLMEEKGLKTYVKLNPTLLGYRTINEQLQVLGYDHLQVVGDLFEEDLKMDEATELIDKLLVISEKAEVKFGVKLTNTLPVVNKTDQLVGDNTYLSGPALFPLTLAVSRKISDLFGSRLPISYSGGADAKNVAQLLKCGFYPITVSSVLLKPGGYKHLGRMNRAIVEAGIKDYGTIDVSEIDQLLEEVNKGSAYKARSDKPYIRSKEYDPLCALCNNCVDTCPNRANEHRVVDGKKVVIHYEHLCNACGNCSTFCIKGHDPYIEKHTITDYVTVYIT